MTERKLGEFELLVLLAAMRLGEKQAYAVSIVDEIGKRTARRVQRAAVYLTLQRLENKGLVTSALGDPRPERGGKARRYVRVEDSGVRAVSDARHALLSMWQGLEPILETDS